MSLDPRGNAIAIWIRSNGTNDIVQAATRRAGGDWGLPVDLSAADQSANSPQLAVDARGTAVAVWERHDGTNYSVQTATRLAGGALVKDGWTDASDLGVGGTSPPLPQVAVDPGGGAVAVWDAEGVQAASRPAGGTWRTPHTISAAGTAQGARVAIDSHGNAVAVWPRTGDDGQVIEAATRPAGGGTTKDGWSTPQEISHGDGSPHAPQVAVDARGGAVAVWSALTGTPFAPSVRAVSRPAGGGPARDGWSEPTSLSKVVPGQGGYDSQVAIDGRGNAVALWRRYNGINYVVQAATRPTAGAWTEPQDLSVVIEGSGSEPQLAVDWHGNAMATWTLSANLSSRVQAAIRPAGGSWGPPYDLTPPGAAHGATVAADAQGNAVAAWSQLDGSVNRIHAAGYDAAGPQLRELRVPEAGAPGSPLFFSVSLLDVWSAVTPDSARWEFGDGGGASGTSVSHTYAAPGLYNVKVSATDSHGNTSSSDRLGDVPDGDPGRQVTVSGTAPRGDGRGTGTRQQGGRSAGRRSRATAFRRCLLAARGRRARRRCVALHGRRPGLVEGLRARALSPTRVMLSFRAAGTDRRRGPAARRYLIKQARRPIRGKRGFRRARSLCGGSCRVMASRVGERVTLRIANLRPRTTYYYAIAARDNVSGRVGPSRTVRVKTR